MIVGLVADDEVGAQQFPDAVSLLQGCCWPSIFPSLEHLNRSWILHPPGTKSKQPVVGVAGMFLGMTLFWVRSNFPAKFGSQICLTRIPWHDISHHVNPCFFFN